MFEPGVTLNTFSGEPWSCLGVVCTGTGNLDNEREGLSAALAGDRTGGRLGEGDGGNHGVVILDGEGVLVTILPREEVVGRL